MALRPMVYQPGVLCKRGVRPARSQILGLYFGSFNPSPVERDHEVRNLLVSVTSPGRNSRIFILVIANWSGTGYQLPQLHSLSFTTGRTSESTVFNPGLENDLKYAYLLHPL